MLYSRSTSNAFGTLETTTEFFKLLQGLEPRSLTRFFPQKKSTSDADIPPSASGQPDFSNRVKPVVYTYIISAEDDSFRFSETGAAFFVDFASKHALHANCAENVRYSGEFHPRPHCGWDKFDDSMSDDDIQWELVIDNNSGTYSPDPKLLPVLKQLFEYNFPGLVVYALAHEDPELSSSRDACRDYAMRCRGVQADDLEPHAAEGEVTLSSKASFGAGGLLKRNTS